MTKYTVEELANKIDHTNLKADATKEDMTLLCDEAKNYGFKMVAINQVQTELCANLLVDSNVNVGAAISFPYGQTTIESKIAETKDAIKNGANEIDYVINITEVKAQNYDYIKKEMSEIVDLCKKHSVTSKVIFENTYLTNHEKIELCKIAKEIKPDFIKTSTGMASSGATIEDVKLMKEYVGKKVKVKAAGGIRDADTFKNMIKHGADRIGASAGITIISELRKEANNENIIEI